MNPVERNQHGFVEFARDEMQSVAELLAADTFPVPAPLLEERPPQLGNADVPTDVYTDQQLHELEVELMWKRVWQWACREEQLPNVGDHVVYDIAHLSVIVVRVHDGDGPDAIAAFENVCQHRGTQLRITDGNVPAFRCPFHGWTWKLDGTLDWVPCEWDFPDVQQDRARFALPRIRAERWGGFVFVNFDHHAEPLVDYLENIPSHFAHFPLDTRFTAIHVQKVMPANWKVVMGAFIESYHSIVTHPQILEFTGDANTQYDIYGKHSRMITAFAVASPHIGGKSLEQVAITRALARYSGQDDTNVTLPDAMTARQVAAASARKRMGAYGADLSQVCDSLMVDAIEYFVFPNFAPWAAYGSPLQYRFRPNGDDVNSAIMDVLFLLPFSGPRPPAAQVRRLGEDESWTEAKELGGLGTVFDQDSSNLRRVQRGLRASSKGRVTLGEYQESRIRHIHHTLAGYLNPSSEAVQVEAVQVEAVQGVAVQVVARDD
jgi:phenylpropionate dioxygenase-like ring-hydroxylating dioxygenase large terminal subunit